MVCIGDPYGIRTRVTAVKGRCLNRLTNGPYLKSYNGYNMTVNLSKLSKVVSYFNRYSLKTKKYIDYFNWLKAYKLVINKDHFNEDGLNRVKDLMNKINK